MADLSKFKRGSLGAPPPPDEASANLAAPETAPLPAAPARPVPEPARIDGRTLRRTHRTVAFATRVSPEFDNRIREIARRDRLLIVEVLERALEAYEHR
jgi:hypothetical protein